MRKVLIPIHIKLTSFFVVVLISAIIFYVFYAINLFEKDKLAYVFESVKTQNDSVSDVLTESLKQNADDLALISQFSQSTYSVKKIFDQKSNLIGHIKLKNNKINYSVVAQNFLNSDKEDWRDIKKFIEDFHFEQSGQKYLKYTNDYFLIWSKKINVIDIGIFKGAIIANKFKESLLYQYILIDKRNNADVFGKYEKESAKLIEKIKNIGVPTGTIVQKLDNKRYISSFKDINAHLTLFTLVEEQKALNASSLLKKRSIYFGLLIVSFTVLLIMLFSKVFTIPIKKLFEASQEFAQNKFDKQVYLKNKDELGVLADSFNEMSSAIVEYMQQMKEKHRLETELQTAKLVQKSFFPDKEITHDKYQLSSFYSPATECGGDWWGTFEHNNKFLIIMADATGHGTPAALITALLYNCFTTIKERIIEDNTVLNSPEKMMTFFNRSLCEIHNDMQATCFIGIIDLESGVLSYSNASHNPPIGIDLSRPNVTKESLVPLIEANGKRLGEDKDSQYTSKTYQLNHNDMLLVYTDGLIEGENENQKQWGKRNFFKEIIKNSSGGVTQLVDNTTKSAYEFYSTKTQDDDITIIAVKWN